MFLFFVRIILLYIVDVFPSSGVCRLCSKCDKYSPIEVYFFYDSLRSGRNKCQISQILWVISANPLQEHQRSSRCNLRHEIEQSRSLPQCCHRPYSSYPFQTFRWRHRPYCSGETSRRLSCEMACQVRWLRVG